MAHWLGDFDDARRQSARVTDMVSGFLESTTLVTPGWYFWTIPNADFPCLMLFSFMLS
jgi:hypothetical protein